MLRIHHPFNAFPDSLSLDQLIHDFQSALQARNTTVTITMWKQNPLLQKWYRSQPVNFGTSEQPDMRTIPLQDLVGIFKSALASRKVRIIEAIWDNNPILPAVYTGQLVNVSPLAHTETTNIVSFDDLTDHFRSVLASRCTKVFKDIWEKNSLLRAWYNGQPVNFGTTEQPDMRTIPLQDLVSIFESALASQKVHIIEAIWDNNPILPAVYTGQLVNVSPLAHTETTNIISFDALTNHFRSVLASRCTKVIKDIWEKNSLLRAWYNGQPVNFGTAEQPDMHTIPLQGLVSIFESALASQKVHIIEAIWDNNPTLQVWYISQPVTFSIPGQPENTISSAALTNTFKSVLHSRCQKVIAAIWKNTPALQVWYAGRPVNFSTSEQEPENICIIPRDELINNFVLILKSRCNKIINAMWENHQTLHDTIKSLDITDSIFLLKKVMASRREGSGSFIKKYLNFIDNINVISCLLSEIQENSNNKSRYTKNKINLLNNRLNEIISDPKLIKNDISKEKFYEQPSKKQKISRENTGKKQTFSSNNNFDNILFPKIDLTTGTAIAKSLPITEKNSLPAHVNSAQTLLGYLFDNNITKKNTFTCHKETEQKEVIDVESDNNSFPYVFS